MYDLDNMTDDEIKEMQRQNREKLAEARDKIKQHKADVRRWIKRGKYIDGFFKQPDKIPDDVFEKKIKDYYGDIEAPKKYL